MGYQLEALLDDNIPFHHMATWSTNKNIILIRIGINVPSIDPRAARGGKRSQSTLTV